MPGRLTVAEGVFAVNPPGPDHAKVGLGALVPADTVAAAILHPRTPPDTLILGGVRLPGIVTVSVEVQREPPADAVMVKTTVPGCVILTELPVPRIVPCRLRHILVPTEGVEVSVIVSSAQVSVSTPNISAIGSSSKIEKLIRLSQPS